MLVYLFIYVSLPPNFKHPQFQTPSISDTPISDTPISDTPISGTQSFSIPGAPLAPRRPPTPRRPRNLFNIKPSNRQNIASYPHLRVKMLTILDNLTCLCP